MSLFNVTVEGGFVHFLFSLVDIITLNYLIFKLIKGFLEIQVSIKDELGRDCPAKSKNPGIN